MHIKDATKELNSYKDIMAEIDNLTELVIRLDSSRKLKAIRYDKEKPDIKIHTDLSDSLAQVETIKCLYNSKIKENLEFITMVESKIALIQSPLYRTIIRKKYIQDYKLEYVATTLKKSLGYIKILHRNALYNYSVIKI